MSLSATTPMQSLILTGLSTVVGVLFLTVAGKVVDKVGQTLVSEASASIASDVSTSTDALLLTSVEHVIERNGDDTEHFSKPKSTFGSTLKVSKAQKLSFTDSNSENTQGTALDSSMAVMDLGLEQNIFAWNLDFLDEGNPVKHASNHRLKLHSRTAFIVDLDSGEILYEKAADARRPSASVTKVLASLTLANKNVDLNREVCTDHRIRTGISGAVTRVSIGDCATGWDFMGAALVSSDNGAAFAFPMVADEELFMFTHDMNQVALDLGMDQSEFVDPAGIYDGNISTARDLTRASVVAAFHPKVSIPGSAKQWAAQIGDDIEQYVTTNKASGRANFLLAKTGYTNTARANFTGVYEDRNGRRIAFTIMGAWNSSRRTKDIHRILDWVRQH